MKIKTIRIKYVENHGFEIRAFLYPAVFYQGYTESDAIVHYLEYMKTRRKRK